MQIIRQISTVYCSRGINHTWKKDLHTQKTLKAMRWKAIQLCMIKTLKAMRRDALQLSMIKSARFLKNFEGHETGRFTIKYDQECAVSKKL